jgi:hypothetical protein
MARRKKRMKPLLYIHQPEYPELSTSMQEKYHFNDQVQDTETEKKQEQNKQESSVAVELAETEELKSSDVLEENESTEEAEELNKKKPFNEMSIIEKIEYLEQFPVSIVKIQYSFVTEEEKVIGYFVSKEDDHIRVIPKGKRKSILIPLEEVQEIKIRGL